jgi:hypothetical protein
MINSNMSRPVSMLEELDFPVKVLAHVDFSVNEAAGQIRDIAIERVGAAVVVHKSGELLRE